MNKCCYRNPVTGEGSGHSGVCNNTTMTKTISEILSSFDNKFPSYLDGTSVKNTWWRFSNPSSRDLPRELKNFLKDSIIEILDGIPLEDEEVGRAFRNFRIGRNSKNKELREYIEKVKL